MNSQKADYLINTNSLCLNSQIQYNVHGGVGFLLRKRITPYVNKVKQISDRVVYLDIILTPIKPNKPLCHVRVVNCYSPTLPKSKAKPIIAEKFYDEIKEAIDVPARYEVFVLGDFNAKLGKRTLSDVNNGYSEHMGKYGVGRRNENGEHLLNFMISNKLFAANTSFQHPSRHITTRTGWIRDKKSKKSTPYYSQIDYILCKSRSKVLLQDSRAYAGSTLASTFYTDHKIVCARLDFNQKSRLYKSRPISDKKFDTTSLICSKEVEQNFQSSLEAKLIDIQPGSDVNTNFENLFGTLKTTAAETVGYKKTNRKRHHTSDPEVVKMANKKRNLRNQLNNNATHDRTEIRREINILTKQINRRLKDLQTEQADKLCADINSTDESRKMFESMRLLNSNKAKVSNSSISVFDSSQNLVANDKEKAKIVRKWFKEHYTADEPALDSFEGEPRPLNCPISVKEVEEAVKRLKNGKAVGPDNIPNELLKSAPDIFYRLYVDYVNDVFIRHDHVASFSEGYLTPLQKPKKPRGPLKSL